MMRKGVLVDEGKPQAIIEKYGYNTLEEVFIHLSMKQEKEIKELDSEVIV